MKPTVIAVAIFACLGLSADATTLKLKNGEEIEGSLQGNIVQRSTPLNSVKEGKTTYLATYTITTGREIESISTKGVYSNGYVTVISALSEGKPLDDAHVAASAPRDQGLVIGMANTPYLMVMNINLKKLYEAAKSQPQQDKKGAAALIPIEEWEGAVRFPILGELQQGDSGSWEINPVVRVSTPDGIKTYRLAEIVQFEVPAKKP